MRFLEDWIRGCLATTNFSTLINGRPRGKIHASRGLHQGDPLSHFLFTIIGDALSRSMQLCLEKKILKRFAIRKNRVESLFFNTLMILIFFSDDYEMLKKWWDVILLIMAGSDLSLNLAKTSLIEINMDKNEILNWANDLHCHPESLPLNYLGFPLEGNHHHKAF